MHELECSFPSPEPCLKLENEHGKCEELLISNVYLIGLFVLTHFAKSVNSNVVQDKTSYDAIRNNLFRIVIN